MKVSDLLDQPVLTVVELAKKYGVSQASVLAQLDAGIQTEMEHTTQPSVAKRIALAHLGERFDYYDKLKSAEQSASGSVEEQGGVGLVVPGVNMPVGQHPDEIRRQARKFGFDVTARGVPPLSRTDGKPST